MAATNTITGTKKSETLYGQEYKEDVISGLGGHGILYGLGRSDTLDGGSENDVLHGGGGDKLIGGSGSDTLFGWSGHWSDWEGAWREDDDPTGADGNDLLDGGRKMISYSAVAARTR